MAALEEARFATCIDNRDVFVVFTGHNRFKVFDRVGFADVGANITAEYEHLPVEVIYAACNYRPTRH